MLERRIPEWLRHAPAPGVRGFALLAGTEAVARGILVSVFPLAVYKALQDAAFVSAVYFAVGVLSLVTGLMVPYLIRFVPRRRIYILASLMFAGGSLLAVAGTPATLIAGLTLITVSTVMLFVCFNAYVLDYIAKINLGKCETSRMFYSALGWTAGPALGVVLFDRWNPAPFLVAATAALFMLGHFLYMRLGNGRLITRAKTPPANPLAFIPRFAVQPRLITGWLFAVIRSCAWWAYIVYLPIFAIEQGLGDRLGGILLSVTNASLFLTPLMLRFMQARSVRVAVRTGFFGAAVLFSLAALFPFVLTVFGTVTGMVFGLAVLTVVCLMAGSYFLILLDVSAGLPFLLAVKPSERTEMSAVYSSYRDVSGIITPGMAWLVLLAAPVAGVFVATGAVLLAAWGLAGRLHPRLGKERIAYTTPD